MLYNKDAKKGKNAASRGFSHAGHTRTRTYEASIYQRLI
jgi:hypothetical protein